MLDWKRTLSTDCTIYNASDEYDTFEIRSWPYDESGEGRFQVCENEYHYCNTHTLREAKEICEGFVK